MKTNNLLSILFILLSLCSFAQVAEENDNDIMLQLEQLQENYAKLEEQIEIRQSLLNELDKKAKETLKDEVDSLRNLIIDNELNRYELRTQLSSGHDYGIAKLESAIDKEVQKLIEEIELLESMANLTEDDTKLLNKKKKSLVDKEFKLKNDLLKRYQIEDNKNTTELIPLGDLSILDEKDRTKLNVYRKDVITKYLYQKQIVESKELFSNQKVEYKATIMNTNFTIPMVRFNIAKGEGADDREGNVELFNSIGAGISRSKGRITEIRDGNGEIIDTKFENTWGYGFGVLFSASSTEGENRNVFAPMVFLNVLDLQLGYGLELGTRSVGQRRGFFAVAYAIPLYKLFKGNFRVLKKSEPITDVLRN